jgi:probable phosphoglycerate mutase
VPDRVRLILVRHSEPDASGKEKFAAGLTAKGKQKAHITADFLSIDRSIKKVFTSSLERARQTAEIISRGIRAPLKVVPELQEIHLGEWEGREPDAIRRESPELAESFRISPEEFQIPGGEKLSVFVRRIRGGLRYILSELGSGTAVLVAHRISIAFIICELLGKDPREFTNYMPNKYCSISIFVQKGPFEFKEEAFDMEASATLSQAKKTTQENFAFFAVSFAIAATSFTIMLPYVSPIGYRNPRALCFLISLSSYIRYLLKYWIIWLRIPPFSRVHDLLNWSIMLVGSATFAVSIFPPIFCFAWGFCYLLVSAKERTAVKEYRSLFCISLIVKKLAKKSKLALIKSFLFFAIGAMIMIIGNKIIGKGIAIQHIILYIILSWTSIALMRDLIKEWNLFRQ